jgi:hypothetical protein
MAGKGEKVITERDMQQRLRLLEVQINSILAFLVFNNTTGEVKNFMIVKHRELIAGAGTTVTFLKPFKVGTVPQVIGTSQNYNCYFALDGAPTATGFQGRSRLHDGTGNNSYCAWIAVGERG